MSLTDFGRHFSLSEKRGRGIYCGPEGVFVGDVPLLTLDGDGFCKWRVRELSEINTNLSKLYGVPIEFVTKLGSLAAVANALNKNDVFYARLTTLHLQIPEPPFQTKSNVLLRLAEVARRLHTSGLLKSDWNPQKHPRWPGGTPGGIGGEFAPAGTSDNDPTNDASDVKPTPAQLTIPAPLEIPQILPPSEILPTPLAPPDINPLHVPQNPYPERPKCVDEWAEATAYCMDLFRRGLLGKGDYRGSGTLSQCIRGQVTEDCGGNSTGA
jgi:hypothetical protein